MLRTRRIARGASELVAGDAVGPQAEDDASVLDASVGIEQLGPHRAYLRTQGQGGHGLQPSGLDHQDVVVDEGEQRRGRPGDRGVVQGREVEGGVDPQHPHPRRPLQPLQQPQGALAAAAVVDDAKTQRRVVGLFQEARHAGFQQIRMVARRHDRRHLGRGLRQGADHADPAAEVLDQFGGVAAALEVLGHQPAAGFVYVRPRALRQAPAAREDAPVIEHVGQVKDRPFPAVRDPQHQVVVLRALEPRPQAPETAKQPGPHREGMVHVVLREQPLGVEIGLEARFGAAAVGVQRVLVRIDGHGVRVGGEGLADRRQGVRRQHVVMVEEQGHVRLGHRQGGVGRRRHAEGLRVQDQPDARIGGGLAQDAAHLRRMRPVVRDA